MSKIRGVFPSIKRKALYFHTSKSNKRNLSLYLKGFQCYFSYKGNFSLYLKGFQWGISPSIFLHQVLLKITRQFNYPAMGYRTTYLKKIARDIPGYFGLLISITKRVLFRLLAPYYLNYFLCRAPAFHMKSVVFRSRSFAFAGRPSGFSTHINSAVSLPKCSSSSFRSAWASGVSE